MLRMEGKIVPGMTVLMFICMFPVMGGLAWAAADKPIVLRYADFSNPTGGYGQPPVYFMKEVEKRTNGRVKFEPYWSNTLVPSNAITDAVSKGLAEVGRIHGGNEAGKLPVLNLGSLPSLGNKLWATCMAWNDMVRNSQPAKAELAKHNVKHLFSFGTTEVNLNTTVKVTRLEDLKGLKIRGVGNQISLLKALGAVPVTGVSEEITMLLERGTIQGLVGAPSFVTIYGMEFAVKYYSDIPFGSVTGSIGMNMDTWKKLPKDIQKTIADMENEMADFVAKSYMEYNKTSLDKMLGAGAQIIKVNQAEKDKLVKIAHETIWSKWVKEAPPGVNRQEVLNNFIEAYKRYEPKDPYQ
ncbi:MAG: TRAP transporter substrate-binding protein DctP [Thermodesulfobacteriota bacterium]